MRERDKTPRRYVPNQFRDGRGTATRQDSLSGEYEVHPAPHFAASRVARRLSSGSELSILAGRRGCSQALRPCFVMPAKGPRVVALPLPGAALPPAVARLRGDDAIRWHRASAADGSSLQDLGHHAGDRKSTRLNSSHGYISYAVFCLKKKISGEST